MFSSSPASATPGVTVQPYSALCTRYSEGSTQVCAVEVVDNSRMQRQGATDARADIIMICCNEVIPREGSARGRLSNPALHLLNKPVVNDRVKGRQDPPLKYFSTRHGDFDTPRHPVQYSRGMAAEETVHVVGDNDDYRMLGAEGFVYFPTLDWQVSLPVTFLYAGAAGCNLLQRASFG